MAYDIYGNYTPDQETEEERKKREAEQAAAQAQRFPPAGPVAPSAVNYGLSTGQEQPGLRYGNVQAAAPVAPQTAPTNQAAYTAQMESGANPNIGYHFPQNEQGQRQSTAYGTYGLTGPAYADVQQANAQFANRPITSLTPEEQTQAYQTYTDLNKQRLQGMGVEPTDANARLAHFLGASGAAKYLQTGEISPQAAAANGGLENVKRIAEQRLAGGQAPASGAVQQPAAQPTEQPTPVQQGIDAYQNAQNDMNALFKLGIDQNVPANIQERARDRALELYNQEKSMKQAQQQLTQLTPNEMARTLTKKSEGTGVGDWLQYLLLKHVGLTDLANQKGEQLGIGHQWQTAYIQDSAGNDVPVEVQTSASGRILQGSKVGTNQPLSQDELLQAAGAVQNANNLKTAQTQATHAYTTAYTSLMKQRDQLTERGASEQEIANRGLDIQSIQKRAQEAGQSVIQSARTQYRTPPKVGVTPSGAAPAAQPSAAPTAQPAAAPAAKIPVSDAAQSPTLSTWKTFMPNETPANFDKRQQYSPEDIWAEASQLASGSKSLKDISGRDSGLLRHYASKVATEIDPTWSPMESEARAAAYKRFTNPDSQVSRQIRAHITTSNSIQDVKQAFDALQNGNTPLFNQIRNDYRQATGNELPIDAKTGMMLLGPEVMKSIIPTGGGVTERQAAENIVSPNASPAQIAAGFKVLEDFQGNALKAMENDWTKAKLPKAQFRDVMLGGSPAAQNLYDNATTHQATQAARRAGLNGIPTQSDVQAEMRRRGLIK